MLLRFLLVFIGGFFCKSAAETLNLNSWSSFRYRGWPTTRRTANPWRAFVRLGLRDVCATGASRHHLRRSDLWRHRSFPVGSTLAFERGTADTAIDHRLREDARRAFPKTHPRTFSITPRQAPGRKCARRAVGAPAFVSREDHPPAPAGPPPPPGAPSFPGHDGKAAHAGPPPSPNLLSPRH
jgi:hypothetical protein